MSSRFITQSTLEKIPVLLFCSIGQIEKALGSLLDVAGFRVAGEHEEGIYAAIVIDTGQDVGELRRKVNSQEGYSKVLVASLTGERSGAWDFLGPVVTEFRYQGVVTNIESPITPFDMILRDCILEESVQPEGGECSILWYEDACGHIVHELLSGKLRSGVFTGESMVSFSQLVQDLRRKLEIGKGKVEKKVEIPSTHGAHIAGRGYEEILTLLAQFFQKNQAAAVRVVETSDAQQPQLSAHTPTKKKYVKPKKSLKKRISAVLIGGSCVVGVLMATAYAAYALELRFLAANVKTLAYINSGEVDGKTLLQTQKRVERVSFVSNALDSLTSWTKQGNPSELHETLPLVSAGIEGYQDMEAARNLTFQAYQALMQNKPGDPIALMKEADTRLENAYKNFSLVQARLSQGDTLFPHELGGKEIQEQIMSQLPTLRRAITTQRSVLGAIPSLLSGDKQHTYAFILEDSTSLRGSGGSIAAVAIASFDKAKLFTLQVYSSDTLAQMMTGSVVPPEEVRTFLRTGSWTLSDATWDASYTKVATQVSWFLGKALAKPIDGVISIPSQALPSLLSALGPLKLDTSGGEVSAQNYQTRLEEHIAKLTQQPDAVSHFYTDILTQMTTALQTAPRASVEKLFSVAGAQFAGSNMFVGVGNEEAQRAFGALSWDGNPLTPSCPSSFSSGQCSVNTVYETENTLGQNSINNFIKRSQVHSIRVGSDVLLHSRMITLTNTSSLLAWPYGTYQVLVKLLVDEHALIQGVSINDQALTPDRFSLQKEGGKLVIRLNADVLVSATTRVRIVYTTLGIPTTNSSLVFFEQKQAGSDDDPFTLIVTYPENYTPKSVAPRADVGRSSLTFTSKHDANRLFGIGF